MDNISPDKLCSTTNQSHFNTACAHIPAFDSERSARCSREFLNAAPYQELCRAVPLYGGEYEQLQIFNPEIDPNDKVALWTWACDNQLLRCLKVRSTTFKELVGDSSIFQVEFNNPDGTLFVLGPCCGANETEMPSVSRFEFTVTQNSEGKFVVMNMPPYLP